MKGADTMKLDLVHDIQTAYRKMIDSMSRPGLISDLREEAVKLDKSEGCFPATLLTAMMLLDTEVTFKVVSEREAEVARMFNQLTYAKAAEVHQADFIFVLQDAAPGALRSALEKANIGELVNPHLSATIVVEMNGASGHEALRLTGPGIQEMSFVQLAAGMDWVDIRAERNIEYPLGIDLMFVDADHHVLCLPRTTQVLKEAAR
jgi:alpha-D-ribose 1-methylphosphonate 5-triphosphate synthase subunit PhnH